jgi:hypothetical protein
LSKISLQDKDAIARRLGLRRPFTKPIKWTRSAYARLLDQFGDEMHKYLDYAGKPHDYWPRLASIEKSLREVDAGSGAND